MFNPTKTMKPLGFFTGYNPSNPTQTPLLHEIQEDFNSLDTRTKLMMRSALCTYQLRCHLAKSHGREPNPVRTMQDSIECNDSDAWEEIEPLTTWLIDFAKSPEAVNIEGLVQFLSDALSG